MGHANDTCPATEQRARHVMLPSTESDGAAKRGEGRVPARAPGPSYDAVARRDRRGTSWLAAQRRRSVSRHHPVRTHTTKRSGGSVLHLDWPTPPLASITPISASSSGSSQAKLESAVATRAFSPRSRAALVSGPRSLIILVTDAAYPGRYYAHVPLGQLNVSLTIPR